jgi:hypothetical protein
MVEQQNALAIRKPASIIHDYSDVERAAKAMAGSGYFTDSREANQAVVKILAGQEMGFGAFASMTGIYIISGRPSVGANLMASAVKGSGRYNYRVMEMSDKNCSIDFYEHGEKIGTSAFSLEDAKKAQTKNLVKFPRNMLFARAMSNGVKWFCPDVFNGSAVYTPEELGADVNEDGQPITINTTWKPADTLEEPISQPEPEQAPPPVDRPSQKMLDSWSALYEQALSLGLQVDSIPADISKVELAERGKQLRARVVEAEKAAQPA